MMIQRLGRAGREWIRSQFRILAFHREHTAGSVLVHQEEATLVGMSEDGVAKAE